MYYAVLLVDINSLRSTRCEERSSSHIPPDLNETSIRARDTPTQYILAISTLTVINSNTKIA